MVETNTLPWEPEKAGNVAGTGGRPSVARALPRLAPFGVALVLALVPAHPVAAWQKALTIEEYGLWRSIGSVELSDDGRWMTYAYAQREVDDTLHVRNLDTGEETVVGRGTAPEFSDDSRWVAYYLAPPESQEDEDDDGDEDGPSTRAAVLRDLATGETWSWERVASFSFSPGSSVFAVRKTPTDREAEHEGVELIVRYLDEGFEELFGGVSDFAFSDGGTHLAYTVDAPDQDGNGLYLLDLATRVRRPLDNAKATYERLTWDEEGRAVAVLRGGEVEDSVERKNVLLAFRELGAGAPSRFEYDPETADFPDDLVISEKSSLDWSLDLTRVFFGVRPQMPDPATLCEEEGDAPSGDGDGEDQEADDEGAANAVADVAVTYAVGTSADPDHPVLSDPLACTETDVADVDIWHWDDDRIQSVQSSQANSDRNRTYRAVVHLDDARFIRLADEEMRSADVTRDGRWAIGEDRSPYVSDWRPPYADYIRIDVETGERTPFLERHESTLGLSPDSENFLYWKDGHVWNYRIAANEHTNLTASAPVSFVDAEDDHTGETPPYGVEGWTEDGRAVVLRHRYDLYQQPLDGSAPTNLTGGFGDANEVRLRHVRTDPEARTIDLDEPLLLSAYGQWTKKEGFYRLDDGDLEELVLADASFSDPVLAEHSDRVLITRSTFREFPDYHLTDRDFSGFEKITDANPQQSEYRWADRVLFDYTNDDGVRLQGTLAIPDGYQNGERLPMLVHFYEKLSQNLHSYPQPRYASSPQYAGYVSNGYLVMEPDVHFRTRTSHSDMVESVEAAVQAVIDLGYADPDAVVLHGHSYSGGGSSYIAARSDMFAAITSGAAPINLRSEFNQIWPGGGGNNHRYDIYGQGRYGTDPYSDLELYLDQSPITHAPTMDTPLLYLHGRDDGTVPWEQGLEWYNALRFLEKPIIWLSYPDEGHGLRRYENQKDFQIRMRQFFDHHAKGAPAPRWMTEGRSFLDKERARATNGN